MRPGRHDNPTSAGVLPDDRQSWRLLRHEAAPGAWNMAVDEVLLEEAIKGAGPVLRFYSWRPYALSLGHFQAGTVVDRASCAQAGSMWCADLPGAVPCYTPTK